ncbi:DUF6090 family protein [Winogradskyella ursingii]
MEQNKTGKYLKYAIGEIILVVIGILIALQINNWNESKKATTQEITILKNIKEDIVRDTLDMVFNIDYNKRFLKAETQLLRFLLSDLKEPIDTINYADALSIPIFSVLHKATFSNLQSSNPGLITNNTLYKDISRFYDFFSEALDLMENKAVVYETYGEKKNYFKKYFQIENKSLHLSNIDYSSDDYYNPDFIKLSMIFDHIEAAKNDEGLKLELNESIFFRQIILGFYADMMKRINELIVAINKELEFLEEKL